MYKDIKDYFVDMKVQFVYDFVRKIQTLMVIGYNHLSQALLITFDMYEAERKKEKQVKGSTCSCQTKNDYILSKDELKRLEHIDYTITSLESEEQRLLIQMQTIYERMMMQKGLIEKVKPSLASKELEEMKDHIETVMENNEKLFQETYMMKFFQFHNQIKKLDKPQKITEVYHKMNQNLKQNFIKQTQKAANRIERARRHNHQNMQSVQVQTVDLARSKTKKDLSITRQSNSPSLFKQSSGTSQYTLAKQRKLNQKMNIELNHLQKQNISLTEQLNSYKFAQKQIQIKYRELMQKFSIVEDMYKNTRTQLDEVKSEHQSNIRNLQLENKRIRQEIDWLRRKKGSGSMQTVSTEIQTDRLVSRAGKKQLIGNTFDCQQFTVDEAQTQTHEQYLLPTNDDEVVKLLKARNEKAIVMLNEKDKKIRDSVNKLSLLEDQNSKIKSSLNIFVGIVEEKFCGFLSADESCQNRKESNTSAKKPSVLQMNSYEISEKIKQVLKIIIPSSKEPNKQNPPQMDTKFKKLASINEKPFHTLPDEETSPQKDRTDQLSNENKNNTFSKTVSDLKSQALDNKNIKRLSVLNILANKRNFQHKIDVQCQTQFVQTIQTHSNNLETRQFQTQTLLEVKNKLIKLNEPKVKIRHSIQYKKQRPSNEQVASSHRKRKNFPHSNRSSETALSSRQKKKDFVKNMNSFQTIKMDNANQFQTENLSRMVGRTVMPQFIQTHRKMISTSSLTHRKDKVTNGSVFSRQFFQKPQICPFNNHREEQNKERLSALIDDSMQVEKLKSKYDYADNQKSAGLNISLNKSSSNTFLPTTKGSNLILKSKLKKNFHNRLASEMVSTFRPISEVQQQEKQNDYINFGYCPQKTFSGLNFKKAQPDSKLALTSDSQFCNLQGGHANLGQRTQHKKKTLLLSIQKYKTQNISIKDILLGKYLTKVIEKWGKDKVKQTIQSLLIQTKF